MEDYKIYKRSSKQYRQYVRQVIEQYNSNGKKTLLLVADNAYPVVDGVWRVLCFVSRSWLHRSLFACWLLPVC